MNVQRRINTKKTLGLLLDNKTELPENPPKVDNYFDIVAKLIPQEVIFVYISGYGLVSHIDVPYAPVLSGILFFFCLAATYAWQKYKLEIDVNSQVIVSTIAFIPWALTIGSFWDGIFHEHAKIIGTFLLILFSIIPPFFYKD